jgi:hypothetical protein
MPLPGSVREQCLKLLESDAKIEYLFPGTSLRMAGTGRAALNFLVAVTEREIVVFRVSFFRRYRPASIWARHPRRSGAVQIERPGSLAATCTIGHVVLEIEDEYIPVVRAAGLDHIGGDFPLDPFPQL